jgi:hypothetical protein
VNAEGKAKIRQALALCRELLGETEPDPDYEPVATPEPERKSTVKPIERSRVLRVGRVHPALGGTDGRGIERGSKGETTPMGKVAGMFADRLGQLLTRSDLAAVAATVETAKAGLAASVDALHRQFEARAHTRKDI